MEKEKSNYEDIIKSDLPHQLAQEHWDWVKTWLEMIYIDAVHGYKHGTSIKPDLFTKVGKPC